MNATGYISERKKYTNVCRSILYIEERHNHIVEAQGMDITDLACNFLYVGNCNSYRSFLRLNWQTLTKMHREINKRPIIFPYKGLCLQVIVYDL